MFKYLFLGLAAFLVLSFATATGVYLYRQNASENAIAEKQKQDELEAKTNKEFERMAREVELYNRDQKRRESERIAEEFRRERDRQQNLEAFKRLYAPTTPAFSGKWHIGGQEYGGETYLNIKSDGTVIGYSTGLGLTRYTGNWVISGQSITIKTSDVNSTQYSGTFEGNDLRLVCTDDEGELDGRVEHASKQDYSDDALFLKAADIGISPQNKEANQTPAGTAAKSFLKALCKDGDWGTVLVAVDGSLHERLVAAKRQGQAFLQPGSLSQFSTIMSETGNYARSHLLIGEQTYTVIVKKEASKWKVISISSGDSNAGK